MLPFHSTASGSSTSPQGSAASGALDPKVRIGAMRSRQTIPPRRIGTCEVLRLPLDRGSNPAAIYRQGRTLLQMLHMLRATLDRPANAQSLLKSMGMAVPKLADQFSQTRLTRAGMRRMPGILANSKRQVVCVDNQLSDHEQSTTNSPASQCLRGSDHHLLAADRLSLVKFPTRGPGCGDVRSPVAFFRRWERNVIAQIWHGLFLAEKAQAYRQFLNQRAVPD